MQEAEMLSGKPAEATVPFALWLLPLHLRRRMDAFYHFARGADDLTDDPLLPSEEKHKTLRQLRDALEYGETQGIPEWAREFAALVRRKLVPQIHGIELLNALDDDLTLHQMRDYESLLVYAQRVAVGCGRMALPLLDELNEKGEGADLAAADALCLALQLLNVVRDAGKDYLVLKRVYLPGDWMRQGGVPLDDLTLAQPTPRLRGVIDRLLERASALLDAARPLPASLKNRRTRILLRAVLISSRLMLEKLKHQNPLGTRIQLTRFEQIQILWESLLQEIWLSRRKIRD